MVTDVTERYGPFLSKSKDNCVEITTYRRCSILHHILLTQPEMSQICRERDLHTEFNENISINLHVIAFEHSDICSRSILHLLQKTKAIMRKLHSQHCAIFSWPANRISFPASEAFPELHICFTRFQRSYFTAVSATVLVPNV